MEELLRCPFCGGEAKLWNYGIYRPVYEENDAYFDIPIESPDAYGVECTKCTCQLIEYDTEAEAIAAWNRRVER